MLNYSKQFNFASLLLKIATIMEGLIITKRITSSSPFYLFVIGIFFIIVSPNLLSEGVFMDGLIYATLANNLSKGIGTFWNPSFSKTFLADFHEHPPLVFGIQSLFFKVFGESRLIEKFYSLICLMLAGYSITKIWKTLNYKHSWLPLLFWLLIPLVSWACCNNMLENTMTVFTTLSILFYLKAQQKRHSLYILLSGAMISLGFLCKGFVAFFPWTFPFLFWSLPRTESSITFRCMTLESIAIFLFTIVPIFLLVVVFPEARNSLLKYLDVQVITSLKSSTTVDSRFFILLRLLKELIPAAIICLLFIFVASKQHFTFGLLRKDWKNALLFILFGLTGVLPIMVSMKQSGYYILATFPFFAIGLSILIYPIVAFLMVTINYKSKKFLIFKWVGATVFFVGMALILLNVKHFGRDKNKLHDVYLIMAKLPKRSIINIEKEMNQDWSLRGYFERYKNISLDASNEYKRDYLLVQYHSPEDTLRKDYQLVPLATTDYKLFKKTVRVQVSE
jgi:4-amino-4-deoxy-L-arabinose transferase-like glycosyltransferase